MAGKGGDNRQTADSRARPRLGAGLWTLVRMLPRMSRGMTAALGFTALVAGLTPVANRIVVGVLVGAVPGAVAAGWDSPGGQRLFTALLMMGGLYALALILEQVSATIAAILGHDLHGDLRQRVMRAAMRPTGVAHVEDPEQMAAVSLARNVGPGMYQPSQAVIGLSVGLTQRLAVVASIVVVTVYVWWLGLALAVVAALAQVLLLRLFFDATGVITGKQVDLARAVYFRDLALTPGAAQETRIFALKGWILTGSPRRGWVRCARCGRSAGRAGGWWQAALCSSAVPSWVPTHGSGGRERGET